VVDRCAFCGSTARCLGQPIGQTTQLGVDETVFLSAGRGRKHRRQFVSSVTDVESVAVLDRVRSPSTCRSGRLVQHSAPRLSFGSQGDPTWLTVLRAWFAHSFCCSGWCCLKALVSAIERTQEIAFRHSLFQGLILLLSSMPY
jgi:hypothetical protein